MAFTCHQGTPSVVPAAHPLMQRYNQMSESVSEYLSAGIRAILPGVGRFGGMQAVQVHNRLYSLAEAGSHDAVLTAQYMFSAEASLTVDRAQFGGSEAAIQQGIVQVRGCDRVLCR